MPRRVAAGLEVIHDGCNRHTKRPSKYRWGINLLRDHHAYFASSWRLQQFFTTLLYIYHSLPGMLGLVTTVLSVTRATSGVVRTRPISERRPAPPRRWKTQRPRERPPVARVTTNTYCDRSSYNNDFLKRKETGPNYGTVQFLWPRGTFWILPTNKTVHMEKDGIRNLWLFFSITTGETSSSTGVKSSWYDWPSDCSSDSMERVPSAHFHI